MRKPDRAKYKPRRLSKSENLTNWIFERLPYELYSDDDQRSDFLTIEQFKFLLKELLLKTEEVLTGDSSPQLERIAVEAIRDGGVTIEVELTYEESSSDIDRRYQQDLEAYETYVCRMTKTLEDEIRVRQTQLSQLLVEATGL